MVCLFNPSKIEITSTFFFIIGAYSPPPSYMLKIGPHLFRQLSRIPLQGSSIIT